ALQSAETDVGAAFGQLDAADRGTVGRENHDAIELGRAHAPAAPEITVDVAAHAVGRAGSGIDQHALVGKLGAIGRNVIGQDLAVRYAAGFHDVEDFFVGRKAQPIRSQHAFGDDGGFSGCAIDAVDVGVDLRLGFVAFVVAKQPERGIGEPDRAVGLHHHVV